MRTAAAVAGLILMCIGALVVAIISAYTMIDVARSIDWKSLNVSTAIFGGLAVTMLGFVLLRVATRKPKPPESKP